MRLMKTIADKSRWMRQRPGESGFMKWKDFTTRVEAISGVRDTDKVLQIAVHCPNFWSKLDLCTIVDHEKRGFLKRFFWKYPDGDVPDGYLVVWNHGGLPNFPDTWHAKNPQHHNLEVPDYREKRAWDSIMWGQLKSMVENHPDYQEHGRVGKIDFTACKPDEVEIGLRDGKGNIPDNDLIITGKARPVTEVYDGVPEYVRAILQKQAQEQRSNATPQWAERAMQRYREGSSPPSA